MINGNGTIGFTQTLHLVTGENITLPQGMALVPLSRPGNIPNATPVLQDSSSEHSSSEEEEGEEKSVKTQPPILQTPPTSQNNINFNNGLNNQNGTPKSAGEKSN
jgi:hypothetical protein